MIPNQVAKYLEENGWGRVISVQNVGGGCVNNGARLQTSSGKSAFLKTNSRAPTEMFAREVEGLRALRTEDGPRVPEPYLDGDDFLLLEDLRPASPRRDYWALMGRQMAALHNHTHETFGFPHNNYIGATPQPNPPTSDGYAFFAEYRLRFQATLAQRTGYMSREDERRIHALVERLPELIPRQPASLLHGDLWSGNSITDKDGNPAIIDPAAYYGWAEADLAMMTLFGAPPSTFFDAYQDVRPLETGWRARFPLYNLYHVINHINLFGRGYYTQAMSIVARYE